MKKILITLVLALIGVAASGQVGFFTNYKSEAKKKIWFTDYKSEADIVVYFTTYKSEAGWKKNSKKHMMY